MTDRHLVLVGMMGAGKTTVGRVCAARLGRRFVDTDDAVERAAAMTVAELFEAEGEEGFRVRERAAVADACASPEPLVIACGGGAVLDAGSREVLRARGLVVWLDGPPDTLAARAATGRTRPLLERRASVGHELEGVATIERLATERAPAYRAAAHVRVDTGGRTVEDVVGRVLEELGAWSG